MQNKPSNDQHKSIYYRLRRSDPHERLSARLRHFSFGAAVFFVVAAAGIVTHSLYNIQIKQGATFRQYAAQQQLLDTPLPEIGRTEAVAQGAERGVGFQPQTVLRLEGGML